MALSDGIRMTWTRWLECVTLSSNLCNSVLGASALPSV